MKKIVSNLLFLILISSTILNAQNTDTLTIIGVGDIMLGSSYPSKKYLPPGDDSKKLLKYTKEILKNADVSFCNVEGSFLDDGPVVKKCDDPALCYAFRMPERYFETLTDAGFDLFSLSNNHSGDFGWKGRKRTMELIENAGLTHAGLLSAPTGIFEKDGVKYGLCAFSPIDSTCRIEDEYIPEAIRIIKELDTKVDVIIASFHGGAEGSKHERVARKTEIYYDEDRGNVYKFSRALIDAGADVVFGHGPHVTRAVDLYKDRFIIYSLGNFCTWGRFNLKGPNGIAPIVKVYTNKKGEFLKANVFSVYQQKTHGPKPDPQKRAWTKIKSLTKNDFPESKLKFVGDGTILKN